MSEEKKSVSVQDMLENLGGKFNILGPLRTAGKVVEEDHALIQGFYERALSFMKANAENVQVLLKLYEEAEPVLKEIIAKYEGSNEEK